MLNNAKVKMFKNPEFMEGNSPTRDLVQIVVRTLNGNDHGKRPLIN